MSDEDKKDEQSNSLEDLLLQSDLLAAMSRADGKVLGIENVVASSYFDNKNPEASKLVKSHYDYVVQDEDTDTRLNTVMSFMTKLNTKDKHQLLRCLSAVAICDGELDQRELKILKQFAKVMGIKPGSIS